MIAFNTLMVDAMSSAVTSLIVMSESYQIALRMSRAVGYGIVVDCETVGVGW